MKRSLILLFSLCILGPVFGQSGFSLRTALQEHGDLHPRCGQPAVRNWALHHNPTFADDWEDLQRFTENFDPSTHRTVITVPVVVHVIYRNAFQNITDAQIISQIDVLNQDFRRLNVDAGQTPSQWQTIAADVEIDFCLAGVDPAGNPSTGITRTSTTVAEIGNGAYYSSSQGGKDAWNTSKYLNIWVCEIESAGDLLGFAYTPGSAPANEDGVVMDYRYFGSTGIVQPPLNRGRTCTHEVGHYFNLEHIWGINGGCNDDDFVNDTPDQFEEYYGCPGSGFSCNSDDMYMNFMDYVDDACMNVFTLGQKTRMLAALNGPRSGLLSTGACTAASLEPARVEAGLTAYPNPFPDEVTLSLPEGLSYSLEGSLLSPEGKVLRNFLIPPQTTQFRLSTQGISSGFYLIRIRGNQQVQTLRVAKI